MTLENHITYLPEYMQYQARLYLDHFDPEDQTLEEYLDYVQSEMADEVDHFEACISDFENQIEDIQQAISERDSEAAQQEKED